MLLAQVLRSLLASDQVHSFEEFQTALSDRTSIKQLIDQLLDRPENQSIRRNLDNTAAGTIADRIYGSDLLAVLRNSFEGSIHTANIQIYETLKNKFEMFQSMAQEGRIAVIFGDITSGNIPSSLQMLPEWEKRTNIVYYSNIVDYVDPINLNAVSVLLQSKNRTTVHIDSSQNQNYVLFARFDPVRYDEYKNRAEILNTGTWYGPYVHGFKIGTSKTSTLQIPANVSRGRSFVKISGRTLTDSSGEVKIHRRDASYAPTENFHLEEGDIIELEGSYFVVHFEDQSTDTFVRVQMASLEDSRSLQNSVIQNRNADLKRMQEDFLRKFNAFINRVNSERVRMTTADRFIEKVKDVNTQSEIINGLVGVLGAQETDKFIQSVIWHVTLRSGFERESMNKKYYQLQSAKCSASGSPKNLKRNSK